VSYAARGSLQPALAPLEAFEVIAPIARTAEIEFLAATQAEKLRYAADTCKYLFSSELKPPE
jgi:hypothetical protein